MTALRVIGLDLSITATGIAYRDGSTGTAGGSSAMGDRRLVTIVDMVDIAVGGPDSGLGPLPDLVVLEDLPTHAKSAGVTGMVHGAVRALLVRRTVPYALVTPATLKAYATGKGTADKTAMAMAAYKRAGREFADDNQCDAWWLRAAGLDRLGHPEFPLPGAQRDRLDKATWPA
ncbi:Holliday junction endonuclease [Streptomyces sp. CAU 1734]|uniref:Holliday junction endonuclease n=1 Tax=Streptomyces sp. CAU 1734 TaxID=3140360 RepID=UPI003260E457